jgi:adenine-specific DNA methylase
MARWEAGAEPLWINAAKELIKTAYPETPVAFDPFSGYGAIPAEAARLGCQSIASDLNPVAILCLKTMLEAIPKHGETLINLYEEGISFIKTETEKRLIKYYPKKDGRYPIAYLWARTITCEGPACGAEIPLISQTTIAKGKKRKAWIEIDGDKKTKKITINIKNGKKIPANLTVTVGKGHALCPVCKSTTHKERVKAQGKNGKMGQRLFGVALPLGVREGKEYINSDEHDEKAFMAAKKEWNNKVKEKPEFELTEVFPYCDSRNFNYGSYGARTWGDLFSPRQKLSLSILGDVIKEYGEHLRKLKKDEELVKSTISLLALGVSNIVHYMTNISTWLSEGMISCFIQGNTIAMRMDWAEANPMVDGYAGGIDFSFTKGVDAVRSILNANLNRETVVLQSSATKLSHPDDSADLFFTDPPYYDVIQYGDLSDVCFIWLKRFVGEFYPDLFSESLTPKNEQIVVNPYAEKEGREVQSSEKYRDNMTLAFSEGRRVLKPNGIGCVVFAHKGTTAWETLLASIVDAGFIVTASWPIDTERAARMLANNTAALQTSVHLVVRPRENPDGSLRTDVVGDWRDVLRELPVRIRVWMKRMADEGVAGADALFACLGPALEVFSKYSVVEKPNGEVVTLREYMEKVWETVSREALAMLFDDAATEGFEPDARVTAIWLWTLASKVDTSVKETKKNDDEGTDEDEEKSKTKGGFSLDSDTANRIAQSLGADIHDLYEIIEVKGDKSRLVSVRERMEKLFKANDTAEKKTKKRKNENQARLFDDWEIQPENEKEKPLVYEKGASVLDRLHQAMLFFALGRTAMLKKFLTEDGVGRDERFWKLAQALNSLYPQKTDERRWLEGVQAYRKSLNL